MKKIFYIVCLLIIATTGFSQSIVPRTNSSYTVMDSRWKAALNLFVPTYADTTAANAGTAEGIDSLGAIIYTYDVQSFWGRQLVGGGKTWVVLGSGGGGGSGTVTNIATGLGLSGGPITTTGTLLVDTASASILSRQRAANTYQPIGSYVTSNIYTADGTLSANRTVTLDGKILNISQGGNNFISIDPTANAESVFVQAYNTTGGGNYGQLNATADISQGVLSLSSVFDGGGTSKIYLLSNTTTDSIGYESDRHSFIGEVRLHSLAAGVSTDSVMVWNPTTKAVGYVSPSSLFTTPGIDDVLAVGQDLTTDRIIDINGNILTVLDGANVQMVISGLDHHATFTAYDGAADVGLNAQANYSTNNIIFALFADKGSGQIAQILGEVDTLTAIASITHEADTHTFIGTVKLGTAGSSTGIFTQSGVTSGTITFQPAAAAGTYTLTWPTTDGGVGEFLQTNGSGVLTWAAAGGGLTVGTTTITSGTTTRVLFDNAGVLGEYTISGTGSVAMTTSPTFTTSALWAGSTSGTITIASDALSNTIQGTVLSGAGPIPVVYDVYVRSDETLANSATDQDLFTDAAHNTFAVQANTTYEFDFKIDLTHGAVAHSVSFGMTPTTATITNISYNTMAWATAVGTTTASQNTTRIKVTTTTAVNLSAANAVETVEGKGWFTVGATGGTITPQIKFSVDPTGTVLLKAGAEFHVRAKGNNTFTQNGPWQ